MKQPTLLTNIGIALLLFAISAIIDSILLPGRQGILLLIALSTFLYMSYLIYTSCRKVGKIILAASCLVILAGSFIYIRHISSLSIVYLILIWVVRSLLSYSSIVSVLLDAVLCSTGLAIAGWVFFNSGSIAVATWSFFLVQSLHVLIPYKTSQAYPSELIENDRFNNALQTAEYAIKQMVKGATEKLV